MKHSTFINNGKCLEWGINATQGALFDLLAHLSSWADEIVMDGMVFYWVSREKVIKELPLYYSKADTVYRHLVDLKKRGLIEYAKFGEKDVVALTAKGKTWSFRGSATALDTLGNKSERSEINPKLGNESESVKDCEAGNLAENEQKFNKINKTDLNPKLGNKSDTRNEIRISSDLNPTDNNTRDYITTPLYPPTAEAVGDLAGNADASPADPNGSAGVSGDGVGEQTGSASARRSAKPKRFDAPVDALVAIYNEVAAGVLPTVQKITDARRKHINARWLQFKNSRDPHGNLRYADEQSGLLWWRSFFRKVLKNERWAGGSGIEWTADFDWIVKEANFIKILEWKPANQGNRHAA